MRRYAVIPVVLLMIAAFVAAWVNAQEGMRRRATGASLNDLADGDFAAVSAQSDAPGQFPAEAEATPIEGDPELEPIPSDDSNDVLRTAGPITDVPEEVQPRTARRPLRGGSRLGPTVMPAAPIAEPADNLDGEILSGDGLPAPASPNMPSVLKKKPGTPPSAAMQNREPRLTPTTIGAGEPIDAAGSSRRATPSSKPSIRANEGSPAKPAVTRHPQMLQLSGASAKLVVDAVGPQAVTVGKPAAYTIRLANDSETTAEDVEVRIGLPQWVQVQGGEGTRGEAKQEKDAAGRSWLVWALKDLAGGGKEQLSLQIIVQQNQPFEIALHCTSRPTIATAEVAVREPQVEVRLEGPSDMLFGEQKTFTLHVSNPGTGDAENVVVEVSSGGGQPNRLQVGTLSAGQQKEIPFSVGATSPGEMEIRAAASGAGGLATEAASRVMVHKAELQVAIDVPPLKFAGAESSYQVAVANIGDATAEQVTLSIALPAGAKYLGGLDGAAKASDGLTLKIGNLAANGEKVFEVRCMLMQAGENHFDVTAQGKGDLMASATATTQVEALADLKLQVSEPATPVAVGGEAVYEVHLTNRGTRSAEKVKVVVQFAQGIEPLEVIGGNAQISNGQAIFEPLAEVAAGKEVVLKVKAKGEKPGSHAFRVEVKSDPETRLVSEGITRCFAESATPRATARKPGMLQPTPATKIR